MKPIVEEAVTDKKRVWNIGKALWNMLPAQDKSVSGLNWIYQPNAHFKNPERYYEKRVREQHLRKAIERYCLQEQAESTDFDSENITTQVRSENECTRILEHPKVTAHPKTRSRKRISGSTEQKLLDLGYSKYRNSWVKEKRVVHIVNSSEFNERIRISWNETWKDDYAIIYDYSAGEGPVCIVPIPVFFKSNFVKQKRNTRAYANSGYKWSQPFHRKHQLTQLVLSFEDRIDLL